MHKCYNYTKIKKGEPNLEKLKNCLDKWGHYSLAAKVPVAIVKLKGWEATHRHLGINQGIAYVSNSDEIINLIKGGIQTLKDEFITELWEKNSIRNFLKYNNELMEECTNENTY